MQQQVPKPDKKKYQCFRCKTPNLTWGWDFSKKKRFLVDADRFRHICPEPETDIFPGSCKYCKTTNPLFWVRKAAAHGTTKWELLEEYGLPHACQERGIMLEAHKAALREDYAFEKRWINSIPEGAGCCKCEGKGWKHRKRRKKLVAVKCLACKGVGTFHTWNKKRYLKNLRSKYWPYRPWMR